MSRGMTVVLWERLFGDNGSEFLACFGGRLDQYQGLSAWRKGCMRVAKKAEKAEKA